MPIPATASLVKGATAQAAPTLALTVTRTDITRDDVGTSVARPFNKPAEPKKPNHVPVDPECPLKDSQSVYIDSLAGESFEAVLNQVDLNENANRFYCLQLLTSTKTPTFAVWTRWGRIGETGQNALKYYDDLSDAKSAFERKFNDNTGLLWDERFAEPKKGKYTLIERPGERDEKAKFSIPLQERVSPPTTLHPKVKKLVEFIFSKIKKGTTMCALNNKITEECTDVDSQFLALGLAEATPLDHESDEFKKLQHYYRQSHPGATRADDAAGTGYSATIVEDIFRITRKAEMEAFAAVELKKAVDARKLLWHGSRCSNIGGILSQGLKIAPEEAPVNGHVWGEGIYLTDESRKSWEFCYPSRRDGTALLLLCEVQIGDPVYEVTMIDIDAGEEVREKGLLATVFICWKGWEWVDAGQVNEQLAGVMMPEPSASRKNRGLVRYGYGHNEYVVYNTNQVRLRYLLRVSKKKANLAEH